MQWLSLPGLASGLTTLAVGLIYMYKSLSEQGIQIKGLEADLEQHRKDHREDLDRQERRNDAQDALINKQGELLARVDQNVSNLVHGLERIEKLISRN